MKASCCTSIVAACDWPHVYGRILLEMYVCAYNRRRLTSFAHLTPLELPLGQRYTLARILASLADRRSTLADVQDSLVLILFS